MTARSRFGQSTARSGIGAVADRPYSGRSRSGSASGSGKSKLYRALALAVLAGGGPSGDRLAQSFQQPFELGLAMLHPGQTI